MSKPEITYDEFSKLDVRIGTIVHAEIVPDADKLLRLEVDLGEEQPRQIVSGIREFVDDPSDLVGKQTTFIVNLEPRVIRGFESQGMLFAVGASAEFSFLHPDVRVPAGSSVI